MIVSNNSPEYLEMVGRSLSAQGSKTHEMEPAEMEIAIPAYQFFSKELEESLNCYLANI